MKLAWSKLAVEELGALRRYSIERWGLEVTTRYLADIRDGAKHVAAKPALARPITAEFRLVRVRSHYLVVSLDTTTNTLIVARVLHVAMDLERHLPPV